MNDEQKRDEVISFKKFFNISMVIILVLLIFIALFTFFFSMHAAISVIFEYQYAELIKSIFSLVVLVIAVYLVKMFLPK